jgi:hypothetical protein
VTPSDLLRDPELRKAIEAYDNPRGLPEGWIVGYLTRNRLQLAIDVMRAFDENARVERINKRYRFEIVALTSIITSLAWEGLKALMGLLHH